MSLGNDRLPGGAGFQHRSKGGSASELAALMPNTVAFDIEGRDHLLAVGDKSFKARVLQFLGEHPL